MAGRKPNRALERAYRRYPSLFPFGLGALPHLDAATEATAPFDVRLKGAWAYIVSVVIRAWKGYREREKACVGLEDAMQDVVVALIEKDGSFDPRRGRYTTFAKMVALQAVAAKRRHARAVSAPTGPIGRVRKYEARAADGTLSGPAQRTLSCLRTVLDDQDTIGRALGLYTDPDTVPDEVGAREESQRAVREVVASLPRVGPLGATALARRWGLFRVGPGVPLARIPGHGPRRLAAIEEAATRTLGEHIRARRRQHESDPHRGAGGAGASPGGDG